LKLSLEWSMDDHMKDSKKIPQIYTNFDYLSLEFIVRFRLIQSVSSKPCLNYAQGCNEKLTEKFGKVL
jgi:hypothetical protein